MNCLSNVEKNDLEIIQKYWNKNAVIIGHTSRILCTRENRERFNESCKESLEIEGNINKTRRLSKYEGLLESTSTTSIGANETISTNGFSFLNGADAKIVEKSDLLEGELDAVIVDFGVYLIRCSHRIYKASQNGAYIPEEEKPLSYKETEEYIRQYDKYFSINEILYDKKVDFFYRRTTEIRVSHKDKPKVVYEYVCRAAESLNSSWAEQISDIFCAKENENVPNKYASIFVHLVYCGSSFSTDSWYLFDPIGNVKLLHIHGMASEDDIKNAKFIDIT